MSHRPPKPEVLAFKVEKDLADPLNKLSNKSAFMRRALGRQALDWVVRHLATLPGQPVGRTGSRAELEALLRRPAPETGRDFAEVLREFEERVAALSFRTNHPRFLAFIPSAPSFLSVLGELLCAGTNFFAGVWLEAAGPSQVEILVLDWFKELLGCPPAARGVLTGG